jgi:hypothetical protein
MYFQAYISYVKGIDPLMTPECEAVLTKYYQVSPDNVIFLPQ